MLFVNFKELDILQSIVFLLFAKLIIYSNNTFNILYIANILNLVCKIEDKKLQKNIATQINCSKEKKSIKITSNIQKIMQKDNVSSYY